ncbi:MAG: GatB/YqeY domain-containing protein [Candidatus Dojkabacteria bacterium]
MSLLEDIRKDMFSASKQGISAEVDILKMALAEIKNEEIKKGESLSDDEVIKVLRRESKKIEDSIVEFTKAGREDLVVKEKAQFDILQKYLPALLDESKIEAVVKDVISKIGAEGMRDMGRVMGTVMKELEGQADGRVVKEIVQKHLS